MPRSIKQNPRIVNFYKSVEPIHSFLTLNASSGLKIPLKRFHADYTSLSNRGALKSNSDLLLALSEQPR